MEGPVKKALGIPSEIVHGKQSGKVFQTLNEDFMKPVIHVGKHQILKEFSILRIKNF